MRRTTKILLTAAATAVLGTVVTAVPAQAYAGTPGCVTLREFRSIGTAVGQGMTQRQVARRFGTYTRPYWGFVSFYTTTNEYNEIDRQYRVCNSAGNPLSYDRGYVEVDFSDLAADLETHTVALRSYDKSRFVS